MMTANGFSFAFDELQQLDRIGWANPSGLTGEKCLDFWFITVPKSSAAEPVRRDASIGSQAAAISVGRDPQAKEAAGRDDAGQCG
jgi:hypothetical protein